MYEMHTLLKAWDEMGEKVNLGMESEQRINANDSAFICAFSYRCICALVNWFVVFVMHSCVWRVQMHAFVLFLKLKPRQHIKMPFITTKLIFPVTNWGLRNYMHHGTINCPVNHPVNITILILLNSLSLSFIHCCYYSDATQFFLPSFWHYPH